MIIAKRKVKWKGVPEFTVRFIVDKSLNKYSGKVLFPEKLAKANYILSRMKW